MNENLVKRNECLAQTVIKGLQSRNMSGYYAANKEEALKQALELIPEGSSIAMGGCMSAHEIGLIKALEEGNYNYIDRAKLEPRAGLMAAYDADVFLSSANAITDDGIMVNIDGNSNRVSCIAQGPKKVVFIVGINKVCSDLDAAMKRARNVAAPANAQRFDGNLRINLLCHHRFLTASAPCQHRIVLLIHRFHRTVCSAPLFRGH